MSGQAFHPGVHRVGSFMHGEAFADPADGPGATGCAFTYVAAPPDRVASSLLEDVGGWWSALRGLPADAPIPAGVLAAVERLHDTVCDWVELMHAREGSDRRRVRAALGPRRPDAS